LSTSVHRVTNLTHECVLELLKLRSNLNECKPLVGGPAAPGRRHTFPLSLPEGALLLKFELVGGGDSVVFTRDVNVVVKLDVNGWLQVGPARCWVRHVI